MSTNEKDKKIWAMRKELQSIVRGQDSQERENAEVKKREETCIIQKVKNVDRINKEGNIFIFSN